MRESKNIVAIRDRVLAAFLCFFVLACGVNKVTVGFFDGGRADGRDAGGTARVGSRLIVAYVPKAANNPIFELARLGSQTAADELRSATGISVIVDERTPAKASLAEQHDQMQAAILSRSDGIIVSCVDDQISSDIAVAVNEERIPVITFDSDCPSSKERLIYVSIRNEEAGAKAADLLAYFVNEGEGQKHVAILNGLAGADNLKRRVRGFKDRLLSEHSNVKVVAEEECDETSKGCGDAIEGIVESHGDLDGLFITGLWGLQAACPCDSSQLRCESCDTSLMPKWADAAKEGRLKTVSFDTLPFQLALMRLGYVSALISQDYYGWGYKSVELMFDRLVGGATPSESEGDLPFDVVCQDNVDEMSSKWQSGNFSKRVSSVCPCR